MNKITAKEAAELSLISSPTKALDRIYEDIKQLAMQGENKYKIREYEFSSGKCYCSEDKFPEICKAILKDLRSNGFGADVKAYEGQFVDMWLEVTW